MGEALFFAFHTLNQTPKQYVIHTNPFDKWYGYKPLILYFKFFGSCAWLHIPKEKTNKLKPIN
jgi:hypothetical protein